MHQETMDAPVAIEEGVHKHEPECRNGSRTHGMNRTLGIQQLNHHAHPTTHERANVFRFGTDEVNFLGIVGRDGTNEYLNIAPVALRVPGIDDGILQIDERAFPKWVKFFRPHERAHETLRTVLAWRLAFDRERRFRLLGEQIMHGPLEHARVYSGDQRLGLFSQILVETGLEFFCPANEGAIVLVAQQIVENTLPFRPGGSSDDMEVFVE